MAYNPGTAETRQKIKERLQAERPPDDIEDLKRQLQEMTSDRNDWKWAYCLTEGILKHDRKWAGANERFRDQRPIEAAKLAKELVGVRRPAWIPPSVPPVVAPDYYGDLINWLKAKPWRKLMNTGNGWLVRDEAMSREIRHASIDDLLKTEAWDRFKKGL